MSGQTEYSAEHRLSAVRRRRRARRTGTFVFAVTMSLAGHALILLALLWARGSALPAAGPGFVEVSLAPSPVAAPIPAPPSPDEGEAEETTETASAEEAQSDAAPAEVQQTVTSEPSPIVAAAAPSEAEADPGPPAPRLTDAQLASARTAPSGGGGGGECNMVQWLQDKLRENPEVRAAVAQAEDARRGAYVWNGDWIRSQGEEGEGLAVVRQAMMVHIAFAPPACRAEPVDGLVVISLSDSPGGPKVALGQGRWDWSDLLFAQ
jgi:hypothetical protein